MQNKLIAMHNKAHVALRSYSFQTHWECEVEGKNDDTLVFEITGRGDTPEQALDDAYAKWSRVTKAVPEFIGMLPVPEPEQSDHQDGDQFVTSPSGDDDIPF